MNLHLYRIYQDLDDIFKDESSMSYLFGRVRGILFSCKKHQKRFVIVLHILMDLHSYRWWLHHPQNSCCEIWLFSVWFPIDMKQIIHPIEILGPSLCTLFWSFSGCDTFGTDVTPQWIKQISITNVVSSTGWMQNLKASLKLQPFISQK